MEINIIKSNRLVLIYTVRPKESLMPTKIIIYQCVESDNIVYKKKFLSHGITFRVNSKDKFTSRIRSK